MHDGGTNTQKVMIYLKLKEGISTHFLSEGHSIMFYLPWGHPKGPFHTIRFPKERLTRTIILDPTIKIIHSQS